MEVFVKNFNKVMYGLQISQVIVSYIHTYAEVQSSITAVDNLEIPKLKGNILTTLEQETVKMTHFNCFHTQMDHLSKK